MSIDRNDWADWFWLTLSAGVAASVLTLTGQILLGFLTALFVIQLGCITYLESLSGHQEHRRMEFNITVGEDVKRESNMSPRGETIEALHTVVRDCNNLLLRIDGINPTITDSEEYVIHSGGPTALCLGDITLTVTVSQRGLDKIDDAADAIAEQLEADERIGEVKSVDVHSPSTATIDYRRVMLDEFRTQGYGMVGDRVESETKGRCSKAESDERREMLFE